MTAYLGQPLTTHGLTAGAMSVDCVQKRTRSRPTSAGEPIDTSVFVDMNSDDTDPSPVDINSFIDQFDAVRNDNRPHRMKLKQSSGLCKYDIAMRIFVRGAPG